MQWLVLLNTFTCVLTAGCLTNQLGLPTPDGNLYALINN